MFGPETPCSLLNEDVSFAHGHDLTSSPEGHIGVKESPTESAGPRRLRQKLARRQGIDSRSSLRAPGQDAKGQTGAPHGCAGTPGAG